MAAFPCSWGRCVRTAGSGLGGDGEKSSLLFPPSSLLQLAVRSKASEALPRLKSQSNATCVRALIIISHWEVLLWSFALSSLLIQLVTYFGEKLPVFFRQYSDCSIFRDFPPQGICQLSVTEESLSEHYSKTSWVSIGLLIALGPFWTVSSSSSQLGTSATRENCSWWYVVAGRGVGNYCWNLPNLQLLIFT